MTDGTQGWPGFHAMMMAAAYAEEGLCEQAREILREDAAGRRGPRSERPAGRPAWRNLGVGRPADRTA